MTADLAHVKNHDHLCLIYESPDEQAAAFVPFLQAGLVQDEMCIFLNDESDPAWVIEHLRANDFPIDMYIKRGAFRIINTMDAYLQGGSFDLDRINAFWEKLINEALAQGYRLIRATGEMTWALRDFPGCDQLLEYESRINSVLPTAHMIGMCQYNRKRFDSSFMQKVMHTHPFICVSNHLLYNPSFIKPENFSASNADFELRAMIDNLMMSKRLVERQKECEDLYEELISLARIVSHELQAPLTIMQAYLRLLSARYKGKLGTDADEFIGKATTASALIGKMIDSLWNYARVDSPAESVIEEVDVLPIINEVITELNPVISQTGTLIDHDKSFPTIEISRRKLVFVLKELIDNAIKHSRPGETAKVYIGAEDKGNEWQFYVRDNGRGIDNVHSNDVFRLFHRLDEAPSESGVGMGLPICKRIVEHYNGRIWFESQPNSGSTFFFTIPRARALAANVADLTAYRKSSPRRH